MSEPKKVFYQGGSELTDEDRVKIRVWEENKEKERQEFIATKLKSTVAVNFMNAPFAPHEDRVLVYPDPAATQTEGGIFIPDVVSGKEKPLKGTVVRVGPGKVGVKYDTPDGKMPLDEGLRIVYGKYAGTEFEINGIKYLIMRYADIFGRVTTE